MTEMKIEINETIVVVTQSGTKYRFKRTVEGIVVTIFTDNGIYEDRVIENTIVPPEKGKTLKFKYDDGTSHGSQNCSATPITRVEKM